MIENRKDGADHVLLMMSSGCRRVLGQELWEACADVLRRGRMFCWQDVVLSHGPECKWVWGKGLSALVHPMRSSQRREP
ncbi:hypothetical protein [Paenibacillus xylaniclasticus]|uniref:hypothetical protein n=1 Tax=Paenibacillus xylaniclasticus TaxID=588083 RepID=UPI000FDA20CE|nr:MULTISPECIES: hypothetical protein [Paenibacillus]GFN33099.1 hypothetical protein PCURB6_33590 [Paenibacillus curdlanolyticus]